MPELKTRPTGAAIETFLNSVENERRRTDGFRLLEVFREITGEPGEMWGASIIGFGRKMIAYADGREEEWMRTGFSPRKQNLVCYLMDGATKRPELLEKLGKHKTGKACLYVNKLADVDKAVLRELVQNSYNG
ncbi:MAG: DUF1801 domain-containing protein [Pseudomonadota bacterium]